MAIRLNNDSINSGILFQQAIDDAANIAYNQAMSTVNDMFIGTVHQFSHKNYDKTRFLLCNGQKVKKADYPKLYAKIGDLYTKDNSVAPTQDEFVIPNYVDEFLRGGNETNLGAKQADAMQKITGGYTVRQADSSTDIIGELTGAYRQGTLSNAENGSIQVGGGGRKNRYFTFDSSRVVRTDSETRPKNRKILYTILAK